MQNQNNLKILVECAIMAGLATVLSLFKIWEAPLGGAVTLFSMVPIIIIALRHGPAWGFAAAFIYSNTQLLLGFGNIAWIPTVSGKIAGVFLDYIIAFAILGAAGFFKFALDKTEKRSIKIIVISIATLFVCILRYTAHVIVGAVVWYSITKAGNWNDYVHTVGAWTYSIIYNLQYMLPETVITLVAAPAVVTVLSIINKNKNKNKRSQKPGL